MKVQTTHNYKQFSFLKSNRELNGTKVKRLTSEIELHGQLVPILVNEKKQVIDGQHRLISCKAANRPITYITIPGLTALDAAHANTAGSNWNLDDWIHYYAMEGNQNYIDLIDFMSRAKMKNIKTEAAVLLAQNRATKRYWYRMPNGMLIDRKKSGAVNAGTDLTLGKWQFGDKILANALLNEIGLFTETYGWTGKHNMISAMIRCRRIDGFSLRKLFDKAQRYPDLWQPAAQSHQILKMIETLYNWKVKQHHRLPIMNNPQLAYA